MRIVLLLTLALTLTACETQPRRTIYDGAADACLSFGFVPSTEAYGNCMQREVAARRDIGYRVIMGR